MQYNTTNGSESATNDDDYAESVLRKIENEQRLAKKRKFAKISEGFSLFTYFFFIIIRIVLVFVPQYGYIHPDEFFQSSEVISGEVFELEHTRTWEFNSTMPIRSYAIPFFYLKIPMVVLKFILMFTKMLLGVDLLTSYIILIFPRIIICLISFLNDYSIYQICRAYNLKYDIRLVTFASSAVVLTFGIRTFSNTIEMTLCSLLLYLVSDCMILSNTVIYQKEFLEEKYENAKNISERVKYFKMRMSLPHHSYSKCAMISSICVIGIFNRPTFICFGLPLVFFWMLRGMGISRTVTFTDFNLRMLFFITSALPSFFIIVIIDSLYYGYLSLAQIYIMDISIYSFLVTPVNFIRYNINSSNTAAHGEHPKWLHFLINIPILYNILGIIAVVSFLNMFYKFCRKEYQNLPQTQSFVFMMTSAIFAPIFMLSFFNHQEPRFLIPITAPLILLHSPKLITGVNISNYLRESNWYLVRFFGSYVNISVRGRVILKIWYMMNIIFTIFFGFIHQAGVVQLTDYMSSYYHHENMKQIHLVTSHIYSIPESLLVIPNSNIILTNPETGLKYKSSRRFFIYEYGSMDIEQMFKRMKIVLDAAELKLRMKNVNYDVFIAIPSSQAYELNQMFYKHQQLITYKEEQIFYPHLSTEAFPNFYTTIHPCEINTNVDELDETCSLENYDDIKDQWTTAGVLRRVSLTAHQFGLALYKVEIRRKKPKFS
ncbi:GPI mannosyltransferase 4 [Chironomus tepperi]|uniref:GPI mannosyltransferase 4 n=1 Tax=Chironomus tepperi TaxID=113505 RepID=UPI00391EF1ED